MGDNGYYKMKVAELNLDSKAACALTKVEIGNTCMAASYLPSVLVPLVGIIFPAVTMAFLFLYIEREDAV